MNRLHCEGEICHNYLVVVGSADKYYGSIPRYVERTSWSDFPEKDLGDCSPKYHGSIVGYVGVVGYGSHGVIRRFLQVTAGISLLEARRICEHASTSYGTDVDFSNSVTLLRV